ncbi:MAG: hypothetical protein AB9844_04825 [Clostridiaceae bacterium]
MIVINRSKDGIELNLRAIEMGKDVCIVMTGGESHLGAVTVGAADMDPETVAVGTHKEYFVTDKIAGILKEKYSGSFVICSGIHFENIKKEEIEAVLQLSCNMAEDLCLILESNR